MLQSGYMSVMEARSQEEFRSEIVRFSHDLGFDTVSAITVIDRPLSNPEFIAVDNAPQAYGEAMECTNDNRRDPVMQHCKQHSVPIIWNQETYTSRGAGDLWEQQAQFGYRNGVCLALHMPEGRHFVMPTNPSLSCTRTMMLWALFITARAILNV